MATTRSTGAASPQEDTNWRYYDLLITDDLETGTRDVGIFARSDVLKGGQGRRVWSLTRTRSEEEIISILYDSLRNPRWTIHRPCSSAWYLLLRSPSLVDPEDYISLRPDSSTSTGLKLSLRCKSSSSHSEKEMTREEEGATTTVAIPPLPTSPVLKEKETDPLTPRQEKGSPVLGKSGGGTKKRNFRIRRTEVKRGGWGRSLVKKALGTEDGCNFVIGEDGDSKNPLLAFEETGNPWSFSLSSTTRGVLKLHETRVNHSGMAPAFWVAVALAYLSFVEEKEAYNAAVSD